MSKTFAFDRKIVRPDLMRWRSGGKRAPISFLFSPGATMFPICSRDFAMSFCCAILYPARNATPIWDMSPIMIASPVRRSSSTRRELAG
jgi:hypothetical protein